MPSLITPGVLHSLETRLKALRPDTTGRWGSMTAGEMLCHLGDAATSVLGRPGGPAGPARPFFKWLALRSGLPWGRGAVTPPQIDPKRDGTRPGDFEADRERALAGLRRLAAAQPEAFPASHARFGAMSAADWHAWAYRHTDHHLRQFGI